MTNIEKFVADLLAYKQATGISDYELARRAGLQESILRRVLLHRALEPGWPSMTLRTAHRIERAMQQFPSTDGEDNGTTKE